jgi:hypothetical protein
MVSGISSRWWLASGGLGQPADAVFKLYLVIGKTTYAIGQFFRGHGIFVGLPAEQALINVAWPV